MKIKNIGNKIINVGRICVLPNETSAELDAKNASVLKTLEKHGFIKIVEEKAVKPKTPEAPKAPAAK